VKKTELGLRRPPVEVPTIHSFPDWPQNIFQGTPQKSGETAGAFSLSTDRTLTFRSSFSNPTDRMSDTTAIVSLGFLTVLFAIVLFSHSMRLLLIPDFETNQLGLLSFVRSFNAHARVFLWADFALCFICVIPPISSWLLCLEMLPLVGYEVYRLSRGELELRNPSAVRSLRRVKLEGAVKVAVLLVCLVTSVVKILRIE
jgi:hypothetical protein